MDHVGFDLVHCAVYTILHVHIVCDYLCRYVSDNRKFGKVDCVDMRLVYRARSSLPARVVPRSIILSACSAEGRGGLADVISIHSRLTNQILLSRTGKQLVHNFERARSTSGSTSVAL